MKTFTLATLILIATAAVGQIPEMFDTSEVTVGAQRLETRYLFAAGKWSDASKDIAVNSTEIHFYLLAQTVTKSLMNLPELPDSILRQAAPGAVSAMT